MALAHRFLGRTPWFACFATFWSVVVSDGRADERPPIAEEKVVLHTIAGDLVLGLYRDVAPEHVAQILRCVEGGVFDGMHFCYLVPDFVVQTSTALDRLEPLTPSQSALIQPLAAEFSSRRHVRGSLSMSREPDNPNSAEVSFNILIADAPHLDGQYTIFGELVAGWDVIDAFRRVPRDSGYRPSERLTIESAQVSREPLSSLVANRNASRLISIQAPTGVSQQAQADAAPTVPTQAVEMVMDATRPTAHSMLSIPWMSLESFGSAVLLTIFAGWYLWKRSPVRMSLALVAACAIFGAGGIVILASPTGRIDKLIGLVVLVGFVAQIKIPSSGERRDGRGPKSNTPEGTCLMKDQSAGKAEGMSVSVGTQSELLLVGLAALTMALGAATMFALQPMVGKLLAPWLGSVPAVWTACLLFFQVVLLAGYAYVHWLTKSFSMKHQLLLHGAMVVVSAIALPLRIPEFMTNSIQADGSHAFWVFATLLLTAGGPAFVLSTTAPLIQAWFGSTNHPMAANPYPLYIASNAGSLLGLLSYPFFVEPVFTLTAQRLFWSVAWLAYVGLLFAVAYLCWQQQRNANSLSPLQPSLGTRDHGSGPATQDALGSRSHSMGWFSAKASAQSAAGSSTRFEKLTWIGLSFVPSSLLLGVTSHVTMDIAAMPLLWTIPLALYLLSWTVSFSDLAPGVHRAVGWITPVAVIAAAFLWAAAFHEQMRLVLAVHMVALLAVCWTLHRRLYESRPEPMRLTSFYIAIAVGGALGGIFNAIVAPWVFSGFAEYPMALTASLLFLPNLAIGKPEAETSKNWFESWQQILFIALAAIGTAILSQHAYYCISYKLWDIPWISERLGWTVEQAAKWAEYGVPLIPAILFLGRPRMQALLLAAALVVGCWFNHSANNLVRERSFFGVLTVQRTGNEGMVHSLMHGGILHGEQWQATPADRLEPRSYYHREGPLGDIMEIMARTKGSFSIAAIGLGTGSVAAYGQPNRPITFFEIDRTVEDIARNPKYFSYLNDSLQRGCPIEVKIGDARVTMAKIEDVYDVLVIDAFSSDSIPLHLVTQEAANVWLRHLRSDGVIAFHISNRYLDLAPVLGNAAAALGVEALIRNDSQVNSATGRGASEWVVLTASPGTASWFASRGGWKPCPVRPELPVWTDDYASVLPVMKL